MALCLLGARPARADCVPAHRLSTCIDPDTFWPHGGPGPFTFIAAPSTTPPGTAGFGLVTTCLARPIVLTVPTAAPDPIELAAVDHVWDANFLWSLGLVDRI